MKILAIIPAREGSKGITDKNIISFCDKPLTYHSIESALNATVDRVIVSTDSERYRSILEQYGTDLFPFIRPSKLATDNAGSVPVLIHALDWIEKNEGVKYDTVVCIEPTSPIRRAEHINEAIHRLKSKPRAKALVTFTLQYEHAPPNAYDRDRDDFLIPYGGGLEYAGHVRRQAIRPALFSSGDIYVSNVETLRKLKTFYHDKTLTYVLPPWHDPEVDEEWERDTMEVIMRKWRNADWRDPRP